MEQLQIEEKLFTITAGLLPEDNSTELFANRETRKVLFLKNGKVNHFKNLPPIIKKKLQTSLLADKKAMKDLSGLTWSEALEEYAFCLFGTLDNKPDFIMGEAKQTENFRCGEDCRCLNWMSKRITYQGKYLTRREIQILDKLKSGDPDKRIAADLGIAQPTLNNQKKTLMLKLGAQNKAQLVYNSFKENIIE